MARTRSRAAPARAAPTHSRSASTMAHPQQQHYNHPPPAAAPPVQAAPQQPGMFAQMASTAAGVAVGSTIGHTLGAGITGMFGGGSSAPAEAAPAPVAAAAPAQVQQQQATGACEADARAFTKCLDENNGNMQICDWYLQALKACQQAASSY